MEHNQETPQLPLKEKQERTPVTALFKKITEDPANNVEIARLLIPAVEPINKKPDTRTHEQRLHDARIVLGIQTEESTTETLEKIAA